MMPIASLRLARHPFLLLGLATIALFVLIEGKWIGPGDGALLGTVRILIVPFYLVWLGLTILQVQLGAAEVQGVLPYVKVGITCVVGMLPHLLADRALRTWLTRPRPAAASPHES